MTNGKKRIPSLRDIFGSAIDKEKSKCWSDFAQTRVDWESVQNYRESMAEICIAFDVVKKEYGSDIALCLYQSITDDVALLPNEILKAGEHLRMGGNKSEVTMLAENGYFLDQYYPPELSVEHHRDSYADSNIKNKNDKSR